MVSLHTIIMVVTALRCANLRVTMCEFPCNSSRVVDVVVVVVVVVAVVIVLSVRTQGLSRAAETLQTAMTEYFCARCGYTTAFMTSIKRHLQRAKPCEARLCDLSQAEVLDGVLAKDDGKPRMWTCELCKKTFRTKYNLQYHANAPRACKDRPCNRQGNNTTTEVATPVQTVQTPLIAQISKMTYNNIQVNNTYNTTQNIVINAFGNESLEHVTRSFLDQCVRRRNKGIVELIERIHFDPAHQENMNVKATNAKLPLVKVHNGTSWMFARKDRILNELVDKGHGIMQEHFDDNEDSIRDGNSETMFTLIKDWLDKMQDGDKKTYGDVLMDMYILILNATGSDPPAATLTK